MFSSLNVLLADKQIDSMRKYKYTKETLDVALEGLKTDDIGQRKKYMSFVSMASRSELYGSTCDTLGVQAWFLSAENREKFIRGLYDETEEKLLWEYLLVLYMVCRRYIDHGSFPDDFRNSAACLEFKQRAYEVAKDYSIHSSAMVRQISGSIIGHMGDNDVWDIFCNVMLKKRDPCTINYITMGIEEYCTQMKNDEEQIFGGCMTEKQRADIINSLQTISQKSSNNSVKARCLSCIEELNK